jgi:hypothetical protein
VLATSALAVAGYGSAQESSGLSDGLYAAPDAGRGAGAAEESEGKTADSARGLKHVAASGHSDSTSLTSSRAERTWIAILAGVGILISLASGGYVWWSRTQPSGANRAVILTVQREAADSSNRTDEEGSPAQRRAA